MVPSVVRRSLKVTENWFTPIGTARIQLHSERECLICENHNFTGFLIWYPFSAVPDSKCACQIFFFNKKLNACLVGFLHSKLKVDIHFPKHRRGAFPANQQHGDRLGKISESWQNASLFAYYDWKNMVIEHARGWFWKNHTGDEHTVRPRVRIMIDMWTYPWMIFEKSSQGRTNCKSTCIMMVSSGSHLEWRTRGYWELTPGLHRPCAGWD